MDESLLSRYSKPKPKAPKSPHGEQINRAIEITGWGYGKLCGLTKHLNHQQIFLLNKESKGAGALWKWLLDNKYMDRTKNKDYQLVKEKLEKTPDFRERANRDIYLTVLALRKIGLEAKLTIPTYSLEANQLANYAVKFGTYARYWRAVMEDCPELRGKDYMTKEQEEAYTKKRLGYNL